VDEYAHDTSAAASTRYASPKAGGTLYPSESYYEPPNSSWYSASSGGGAYAPHTASYHNATHSSAILGNQHGHDHYTMSNIGGAHNEPNLSQVKNIEQKYGDL
jgi:hypothetical protein